MQLAPPSPGLVASVFVPALPSPTFRLRPLPRLSDYLGEGEEIRALLKRAAPALHSGCAEPSSHWKRRSDVSRRGSFQAELSDRIAG